MIKKESEKSQSTELKEKIEITDELYEWHTRETLQYILSQDDFKNAQNFRHQIGFFQIYNKKYAKEIKKDNKYIIKIQDIGFLFHVSTNVVKYHYQQFKKEKKGLIQCNGRPKPLIQIK